jgi:hypothetical protein
MLRRLLAFPFTLAAACAAADPREPTADGFVTVVVGAPEGQ